MRIIFMGTPDFAVPTLVELIGDGHEIVGVYTQPPRKAGRGQDLRKSPVHETAEAFDLPVFTPLNFKAEESREAFEQLQADVAVVVAYGLILPQMVLDIPTHGCLNLHGSILPRWRGAAPLQRAIMAGDEASGIMVMQMEKGLDTGPVALAETVAITPDMSAGDLHDKLMRLGAGLMGRALGALERGSLKFTPQDEAGVTYAHKIDKAEARINWDLPAAQVCNHILGLSPFPGAWFELVGEKQNVRVKVLRAKVVDGAGTAGAVLAASSENGLVIACADQAISLTLVQRAGKSAMNAQDFLRGTTMPEQV